MAAPVAFLGVRVSVHVEENRLNLLPADELPLSGVTGVRETALFSPTVNAPPDLNPVCHSFLLSEKTADPRSDYKCAVRRTVNL